MKYGPARRVRGDPQPPLVSFDDRPADRQAHPHTVGFGREERVEYPIDVARVHARPGVRNRYRYVAVVMHRGFYRQDARPAHAGHRIDGVGDQVDKHLLQLNSVACYLRHLFIQLGFDLYPVLHQILPHQGKRFPDEIVEVHRGSFPVILLEERPNTLDHLAGTVAVSDNLLECLLRFVQIGLRPVEETQAGIGARYHPGQGLLDFVGNRGRDGVAGHQPRLALVAVGADRPEQPGIQGRYLVQQDNQYETAGYDPDDPDHIPTDAEADRSRIIAERYLHQVEAHHDHQPKTEHGASPDPEHDEGGNTQRPDWRPHEIRPVRAETEGIEHDGG